MSNPLVSVCVPTYNGREHLKECLDSIRTQSYRDFEVVVCDDQSSDGTLALARELAHDDPRFRFIANPRRFGLVGNWNNCVAAARGAWIKFVFQDDLISPTCVERLLQACAASGLPFGFSARDFIFEPGVPEAQRAWFTKHRQRLLSEYQAVSVITPGAAARLAAREPAHNPVGEPTVTLIKSSLFRELGGFDAALIQLCDAEFWTRVMVNHGGVCVSESLAVFRIHARAATAVNQTDRAFRMNVLDPLVIRYRFAFGRHFRPVRDPRLTGKSLLALRLECAAAAAHAWQQARTDLAANGASAMPALTEWQSLVARCAGLRLLAWWGRVLNFLVPLWTKAARGNPRQA